LANDYNIEHKSGEAIIPRAFIVAPGEAIYGGMLVCINASGYLIKGNPSYKCAGVSFERGGPGHEVVANYNYVAIFSLPGVSITDVGKIAYVADELTFTLTPNTAVAGMISEVDVANETAAVLMTLFEGGGAVDSVFGRTGDVVAASGDYDASQIDNDSGVAGAFVDDALDNLDSAIDYWDNIFIDACTAPQALAGTWVAQPTTTQAGGQIINTSNALNDTAQWQFSAHAGTYAVAVRGNVGPDRGIINFLIDGVQIFGPPGGFDLYSPVAVWNVSATALNVNITTTGTHLLQITCTGQNASSTGFYIPLTNVRIWRHL